MIAEWKRKAIAASDMVLCLARKWWRPMICLGIGGSLIVNGVVVPLVTHTYPDLVGLAAVVAAASPFAWFRTYEKVKGGEGE